jgi:hypothetical protein
MLLHLPQLVQQPGFSGLWVAVLNSLAAAAAAGPEGLNDASAAALQNLIIMLHEMVSGTDCCGLFVAGFCDGGRLAGRPVSNAHAPLADTASHWLYTHIQHQNAWRHSPVC